MTVQKWPIGKTNSKTDSCEAFQVELKRACVLRATQKRMELLAKSIFEESASVQTCSKKPEKLYCEHIQT